MDVYTRDRALGDTDGAIVGRLQARDNRQPKHRPTCGCDEGRGRVLTKNGEMTCDFPGQTAKRVWYAHALVWFQDA